LVCLLAPRGLASENSDNSKTGAITRELRTFAKTTG